MDEHTATFEIDSKTDARAVERVLGRLHDSIREESRTVRDETGDSTTMLEQFETLRDAAESRNPGKLTVVLEQREESFEESDDS